MCPSLIEIGSKTAEKNSAQTNRQTNRQTDRHYENNGHLAVNQLRAVRRVAHCAHFHKRRMRRLLFAVAISINGSNVSWLAQHVISRIWSFLAGSFRVTSCLRGAGYSVTACRAVYKFTCWELTPRATTKVCRRTVWPKVPNYITIRQSVPDTTATFRYSPGVFSVFHLYDDIFARNWT